MTEPEGWLHTGKGWKLIRGSKMTQKSQKDKVERIVRKGALLYEFVSLRFGKKFKEISGT